MAYDVIIIGGGHNGLVAAAYLARAGRRVAVFERRRVLGGAAVTEEVFPGFKFSVCSYVVSLLRPEIVRELDLAKHGLSILPLDGTFTPLDNDYLWRPDDHAECRKQIARHSVRDANRYEPYVETMGRMAQAIKPILAMTPPDPAAIDARGVFDALSLAKRVRSLSRGDQHLLVQLLSSSAADFVERWFESDALKATLASSGIIGTFLGVRSPSTAYVLLHHYMGEIDGTFRAWGVPRGGMGAVSDALAGAARAAGATLVTDAPVARVLLHEGRATGVVLANGDEHRATIVVSSADLRVTFERLVGLNQVPADFADAVRHFRFRGASAKVNLALDALPDFLVHPEGDAHLRGAISISPSHGLHGARVRRSEIRLVFVAAVSRHHHSELERSDGGAAGQACDVVFRAVRAVSSPRELVGRRARTSRRRGGQRDRHLRAEHPRPHPASPGRHAAGPGARLRADGGQHLPRRADARSALLVPPVPGWARYRTPIDGLYLCGSSAHPGGGVMGAPGRNAAREILRDTHRWWK